MKTAISVPDDLFERADRYAERIGWSRSRLYATALRDYLRRRSQGRIREVLDEVYRANESTLDEAVAASQVNLLKDEGW